MGLSLLSGEGVVELLENLTYEKTQIQKFGVDLTVKKIYVLESPGSLDFGGSELEFGDKCRYKLEKRDPDDKYSWWNLPPGDYILEYNEKIILPKGMISILQPRTEIMKNGSYHPTIVLTSDDSLPTVTLSVGQQGIKIKQNARISRLMVFEGR